MLPSTPTLAGMGAAAGAGAGGLLGQALGAPREAMTNLLGLALPFLRPQEGVNHESGAEAGEGGIARALPGIAGVMGGLASLAVPGAAPFAGLIGSGIAGVSQMIGDTLAPEAVGAPTVSEIVRGLGVDPDSGGGRFASLLGSVALDPLTYAGAMGGAGAGGAVGGARDALAAREAQAAASAARVEEIRQMSQAADRAAELAAAPPNWIDDLQSELALPNARNYRPEVVDSMPDLLGPGMAQVGKRFRNVEPGLGQDLDYLGLATPHPEGGMTMQGPAPDFSRVQRGGAGGGSSLQPSRARAAMLSGAEREGVAPMPSVVGPNLDRSQGYESVLEDPMGDFQKLRGASPGLGGPMGQVKRTPTLLEALGGTDEAAAPFFQPHAQPDGSTAMLDNPAAMIPDFPVAGMSWRDPQYRAGNVANLPLPDARSRLQQMLGDAQGQADQLGQQPLTPLQGMLRRMGLAP